MARILALETSRRRGSIALFDGPRALQEVWLDEKETTARNLTPTLQSLFSQSGWQPRDVDLIAVGVGPGSFTGVRIGVMTAKTLAYAAGANIVGCDTMAVIAAQSPADVKEVTVVLDAGRGDVYSATYRREAEELQIRRPLEIIPLVTWRTTREKNETLIGPGLHGIDPPPEANVLPAELWEPNAATVAKLAFGRWKAGATDDVWSLTPCYGRLSAAEEKRKRLPPATLPGPTASS